MYFEMDSKDNEYVMRPRDLDSFLIRNCNLQWNTYVRTETIKQNHHHLEWKQEKVVVEHYIGGMKCEKNTKSVGCN